MNEKGIKTLLANPFYCLPKIAEIFCQTHEPIINKELWIQANVRQIKEIGAEEFLRKLLDNLEGKYL